MFGKRARPSEVAVLRARCLELRNEGKSFSEIGRIVGLDHSTVMWHLNKFPNKFGVVGTAKRKKWNALNAKRGRDIRRGILKPRKRGEWVAKEVMSPEGRTVTKKVFVKAKTGTKNRVKCVDGNYYFWCDYCLEKTPWGKFKKTGECDYCAQKK